MSEWQLGDESKGVYERIREAVDGAIDAGTMLNTQHAISRLRYRQEAKDRAVMAIWRAFDAIKVSLKSTPELRARARELATPPEDDFDRAVLAILDDLESIVAPPPSLFQHQGAVSQWLNARQQQPARNGVSKSTAMQTASPNGNLPSAR